MSAKKVNDKGVTIEEKYCTGYVNFNLTNVKVYWAHLQDPDTAFGNNKWCIEMHLEDALAKQLEDIGFNITEKEVDGVKTKIFKAKKEVVTSKGKAQTPPKVVGPDGRTAFTELVGNGSICNLQLSARAWPIRGKWQLGCYLDAVQVVDHVPYTGSSGFADVSGNSF